jgi:hypothetical protein
MSAKKPRVMRNCQNPACKKIIFVRDAPDRIGRGKFCSKACSAAINGRKHGHATIGLSPTYTSWAMMLQRCNNPKAPNYHRYGGVGIKVCKPWHEFKNFLEDMGERPVGTTLDRYPDKKGDYRVDNCRWATIKQQQNNLKNNISLKTKPSLLPDGV